MRTELLVLSGLFLLTAPAALHAQTGSGDGYEYVINASDAQTVTLTGYIGPGGAVSIPTNINGLTVTGIGTGQNSLQHSVFANVGVTSITIPGTVTSIGASAFSECYSLTNVTIPNGVIGIGAWAFYVCPLTSVTIPGSVISIGASAFSGCQHLTSLTIGPNVTTIGDFAFGECSRLTSVTIPDSVTRLGRFAFQGCTGLTNAVIGTNVTTIGEGAFGICVRLPAITVRPGNPAYISVGGVLFDPSQTTLVEYPDGKDASSYTIPNGVTTIGNQAFEDSYLTNITIPDSVTNICEGAMFGCAGLTNITIPTSVAGIGLNAFFDCTSLTNINLPSSLTTIGDYAFQYCTSLTNIFIPSSVTSIGVDPCGACASLTGISVAAQNSFYSSVNGVLFDKSQTALLQFPAGLGGNYRIPNTVTSIGVQAFDNCTNLTSVTIPSTIPGNMASVGDEAFQSCSSLTSAYFEGNAPSDDSTVFDSDFNATVYYLSGASGWSSSFSGIPTLELAAIMTAANPTNGLAPLLISFTAAGIDSAGHAVTNWTWDFGDGSTSTAENPSHTFLAGGTFSVALIETNSNGVAIAGAAAAVTVTPLTVAFTATSTNGLTPLTVSFTSANVDNAGYAMTSWNWSFGDGATSTVQNPTHVYANTGTFFPSLVATNNVDATVAGLGPASITTTPIAIVYSFTAAPLSPPYTNSDGSAPYAGLVLSGNTLYGTTYLGGIYGRGTVYAVSADGTGFTNLHSFTADPAPRYTNSDGAYPYARLVLSGNTLYGTASGGGAYVHGTVFAVNTDGTGFTNVYSFTGGSDGADPYGGLILSGSTLYGTASGGGAYGHGTVFAINTDGTGFTNVYSFSSGGTDGADPYAGLVLSGSTLYGTTLSGGVGGRGTVFAVNTDGTGFTNLHQFTAVDLTFFTNRDGADPYAGLVLSGNTLYGTTQNGGSSGVGVVFAVNTDGAGFTNLYNFTALDPTFYTNNDGANPYAGLLLLGNTLYGTTQGGGSSGGGVVFAVHTNGAGFTNLYSFTGGSDGDDPYSGLMLSGSTLYGTTLGGISGTGVVYALGVPAGPAQPGIGSINLSGANLVLNEISGQSGGTYYVLMSTNPALPLSQWTPIATNVLGAGGNFTITATNTVSPIVPQRFYILQTR